MLISSTLKTSGTPTFTSGNLPEAGTKGALSQLPEDDVTLSGPPEGQPFYRAKTYTQGALAGMAVGTLPVLLSEQSPLAGFAAVIAGSAIVGSMAGQNTDQKIGLGIASTVVGLSSMVAAELVLGKGAGLLAPALGLFIAHAASSTD